MTTYPMMNEQIVDILSFRGDSTSFYAAGRIEELEIETEQIREQAQRAEAEATGIEEILFVAVDDYLYDNSLKGYTENHRNPEKLPALREVFLAMLHVPPNALLERAEAVEGNLCKAITTLTEQIVELETQVADLKADLARNAKMLAQQCDQAREAEIQAAEAKREAADLRGTLQAALDPLEAAADALVPEARVAEAAGLVDEAIEAIREELEGNE